MHGRNAFCIINIFYNYSFYRTKIFIKFPQTLFKIEDMLERRKHELGLCHT